METGLKEADYAWSDLERNAKKKPFRLQQSSPEADQVEKRV